MIVLGPFYSFYKTLLILFRSELAGSQTQMRFMFSKDKRTEVGMIQPVGTPGAPTVELDQCCRPLLELKNTPKGFLVLVENFWVVV